jgi:hypothetical protein
MGHQQLEEDNNTADQVPRNNLSKPASPWGDSGHLLTKRTGIVEMTRTDEDVRKFMLLGSTPEDHRRA